MKKKSVGVAAIILAFGAGALGTDLGCNKASEAAEPKTPPTLGIGSTKGIFYKTCNFPADCATLPSQLDSACVSAATDCISHGCYAMLKSGMQCPAAGLTTTCITAAGAVGSATCTSCGWGTCT